MHVFVIFDGLAVAQCPFRIALWPDTLENLGRGGLDKPWAGCLEQGCGGYSAVFAPSTDFVFFTDLVFIALLAGCFFKLFYAVDRVDSYGNSHTGR